jgi:hypothetical protein
MRGRQAATHPTVIRSGLPELPDVSYSHFILVVIIIFNVLIFEFSLLLLVHNYGVLPSIVLVNDGRRSMPV